MFDSSRIEEKALKTFVVENQETHQSSIVEDISLDEVSIDSVLQKYCPETEIIASIYDPVRNKFAALNKIQRQNGSFDKHYLEPSVILIRYSPKSTSTDDYSSQNKYKEEQSRNADIKGGKSRERTIQEVIEVVKKWRELHSAQGQQEKKRLNLQEAAKVVGVSKKSLDDYYCQLRLGQVNNFDFVSNLHEKIGVLRNFIKDFKPSRDQKKKKGNEKYPKHLKIINLYDLSQRKFKTQNQENRQRENVSSYYVPSIQSNLEIIPNSEKESMNKDDVISLVSHANLEIGSNSPQMFDLEHDFFKDFQVHMDEERDPYYNVDADFRIKDNDFDSLNSLLFFD